MATSTAIEHESLHNGSELRSNKEFGNDTNGYENEKIDIKSDDIVSNGLPPDPDEHLTDEERIAAVGIHRSLENDRELTPF
jgi:hypothetical protein